MRIIGLIYGVVSYAVFLVAFLYAIAFTGGLPVPKVIDSGAVVPLGEAIAWNVGLLGLFAVQHSLMARPAFKRWWTKFVPKSVERSTYVLFASLALLLLYWQWRPMPAPIWTVTAPAGVMALQGLFWFGWVLVLLSTFMISHFELFGLTQVWRNLTRTGDADMAFKTPFLYAFIRHPIYLGFIIAFWATPVMSAGHLLFAAATTAFILIGIQLEERDLIGMFGDQYVAYRKRVSMLIPFPRRPG
jgi:methanethiol S-methyltransferase